MTTALFVAGRSSEWQQPGRLPAGFWAGFWHGLIMPFAFIVSLFTQEVGIYETHNNGNWYNFGFVLGNSISLGMSGSSAG